MPNCNHKDSAFRLRNAKNAGFTMVEVLVATAILTIVAYGFSALIQNMMISSNTTQFTAETQTLTSEVRAVLSSKAACRNSFAGTNINTTLFTPIDLSEVRNGTASPGAVMFSENSVYGDGSVRIQQMRFAGFTPTGTNVGVLQLELQLTPVKQAAGGQLATRRIDVTAQLDAGSNITDCIANSSMAEDVWRRNPGDLAEVFFTDGNTGLGTNNPEGLLHLNMQSTNLPILELNGASSTVGPGMMMSSSGGSPTTPSASASGDILGALVFRGFGTSNYGAGAQIVSTAAQTHTDSARGSQLEFQTVANGQSSAAMATRMRIAANGNIAMGSNLIATGTRLYVAGQISAKSQSNSTGAIDWANGNAQSTSFDCTTPLSFANLRDGGSYTLAVTSANVVRCDFGTTTTDDDAATVTYRFLPANGSRTINTHTIYSLQRIGNIVYVSWMAGF